MTSHPKPTPRQIAFAKAMRRDMSGPERLLWNALRRRLDRDLAPHFRRQVTVGPYIADFVSLGYKLVVEVDGEQHGTEMAQAYDARRSALLADQGFRVLRFGTPDVARDIDTVLDTIRAALIAIRDAACWSSDASRRPTPHPSRQAGGGRRHSESTIVDAEGHTSPHPVQGL